MSGASASGPGRVRRRYASSFATSTNPDSVSVWFITCLPRDVQSMPRRRAADKRRSLGRRRRWCTKQVIKRERQRGEGERRNPIATPNGEYIVLAPFGR